MYAYVTGIPCSCICATYERETVAAMPSKPGKPIWPWRSWMTFPLRSVPGTVGMSVAMFSSTVFAVATWPTLQPARVYGTHGAGAFLPSAVSMLNLVSVGADVVGSKIGSVQYANETPRLVEPVGVK